MEMQRYSYLERFRFGEFFVEFLGSLVPGFLFSFLAFICLGCSLVALYFSLTRGTLPSCDELSKVVNMLIKFRLQIVLFMLAFSYVVGFGFFRQDPKLPDQRSVWRNRASLTRKEHQPVWADEIQENKKKDGIEEETPNSQRSFLTKFFKKLLYYCMEGIESFFGASFKTSRKIEAQFPYIHIRDYLEHRGLKHLSDLIDWDEDKKSTHRAKAFINILKIRLKFAFPDKCGYITRNEAHVRLMSSIWYMSRSLQLLAMISLILSSYSIYRINNMSGIYFLAFISALLIFLGSLLGRHTIEKFFHYQRVREIIYVLETASFASKHGITMKDSKEGYQGILEGIGVHNEGKESGDLDTEAKDK